MSGGGAVTKEGLIGGKPLIGLADSQHFRGRSIVALEHPHGSARFCFFRVPSLCAKSHEWICGGGAGRVVW